VKAIIVGDVHLADHPPSIRKESYLDEILAKLEFAVATANEWGADALIQAGDLIHVKAPSRTSHALVQRTIDVLSEAKMPVLIVPGNHDMSNDRIQSLPKQALGTICKAPGIDMLMGPHPELPVFGIPYLWDFPTLLPQWMKKYHAWSQARKKLNWAGDDHVQDTEQCLVVTHAPIFPPGEEPIYEFIDAEDWGKLQHFGDCYYGHIHDPHGTYEAGNVQFCNQGALSRGSLHEATLKRKPAITSWQSDIDGIRFDRIEVPHLPASEVFRLKEKEDVDERQALTKEFLDGVEQTVLEELSLEEVVHHAQQMGLRKRTLEQIHECVEHAATS